MTDNPNQTKPLRRERSRWSWWSKSGRARRACRILRYRRTWCLRHGRDLSDLRCACLVAVSALDRITHSIHRRMGRLQRHRKPFDPPGIRDLPCLRGVSRDAVRSFNLGLGIIVPVILGLPVHDWAPRRVPSPGGFLWLPSPSSPLSFWARPKTGFRFGNGRWRW